MIPSIPEKPSLEGLEAKWSARWEADGIYRFDRTKTRDQIFAIDTPPPTVSGSLHVGHVFSFTHTDTVARFHRMRGREVWYPMGWDDNGLATERRVQNFFGVTCDPTLPYDRAFEPPATPPKDKLPISRPNFVELCVRLTEDDEQAFEALWRYLGLSVDWTQCYTTIGERARRASQRAFLRMLHRGEVYTAEAPTLWDVDFKTAVAQAEMEDRETPGAYHRVRFGIVGGAPIEVDTTRPELLPSCVALVAHPDDVRYRPLVGGMAVTPLFGVHVPVVSHELAEPDKGTGVAMICTFGDMTDVQWWRELGLPVRTVVQRNGRFALTPPEGVPESVYAEVAGRTVRQAQSRLVELLRESGDLLGDPKPIRHPVKFYEHGERPLEIVTSRQWYVRTLEHREHLLRLGRQLHWFPAYMRARYESWVQGLNGNWNISRQRFFGVPFPVWYPIGPDGAIDHDHPLVASEDDLPVDPSSDAPAGYTAAQRGQPGGFVGDPDVMDTWATSSLTPQIAAGWEDDPDLFARLFPMDMRPQAHEIIRTWLFTTVVKSHLEHGALPWRDIAISGWILDPDRKKMSKSKGNVVTPMSLLEQYGSDAVRYWAASGRPGTDTAFDEGQMKVGRRLAIKLLNVSKFVLGFGGAVGDGVAAVTEPVDLDLLSALDSLVTEATRAFESYDYARSLERTESFFWTFCDDYVELVKSRAYGTFGEARAASATATLRAALSALHRLLAPILPFAAEEVWSWWQEGSIHGAPWPESTGRTAANGTFAAAARVLGDVRKVKSEQKRSMRARAARVVVRDDPAVIERLRLAADDLREAGGIADLVLEGTDAPDAYGVEVVLAPAE
jgi:valyl-tRNA synthetase